jgi:pSer/pThr/pTyr-binding forkhead associated (FHA) protein
MDVGLVCDQCSAFNAMGVQHCIRCGSGVSLDPGEFSGPTTVGVSPARVAPAPSQPPPNVSAAQAVPTTPCPTCGADVVAGHKFCHECGGRMEQSRVGPLPSGPVPTTAPPHIDKSAARRTQFFGAIQAARAKLTVIRGDGLDGVSFNLAGDEHLAGRGDCPLYFPDDPFLSPVHCNFLYREGQLIVRDEASTNGVYVRISGSRPVPFGALCLVGEQLLEVAPGETSDEAIEDGTYFFGSPRRPSNLRVIQRLRGGDTGVSFRATSDAVTIGREGNDLDFPDDPFISGHHARLTWDGKSAILTDLGSKNGTFLRVVREQSLGHGDYVFMGQQLLRVEVV